MIKQIRLKFALVFMLLSSILLCSIISNVAFHTDEAHAANSTQYKIVYHLNGGSWQSTSINSNDFPAIPKTLSSGARFKLKNIDKPLKFGYTFSGWYKNKSLSKRATSVIGHKRLTSRTIYAKWKKTKDPYRFVKTKGKIDNKEIQSVVAALKKHTKLVKRFYVSGGTISVCSESEYSHSDFLKGTAGITFLVSSVHKDGRKTKTRWSPPKIYLRAEWGTNESTLLHEIGHWYGECMQTEKTKSKIQSLYKECKTNIKRILGDYAASSRKEAYAETFSAIKCKRLTKEDKAVLGKWYDLVASTIKH